MCKMTQKSNMIEKCEPDDIILLIPAKKAQYYYFSMACGLIFTMLMMAFTDFLASIFFSFRRVIWNLAHAAAKPQFEFVCELHPLTQHLVFQYFLLLFPEKHPYFVSPKTTTSHIWKLRTKPFFRRTIFRPSFTISHNATRFFAWNLNSVGSSNKGLSFCPIFTRNARS